MEARQSPSRILLSADSIHVAKSRSTQALHHVVSIKVFIQACGFHKMRMNAQEEQCEALGASPRAQGRSSVSGPERSKLTEYATSADTVTMIDTSGKRLEVEPPSEPSTMLPEVVQKSILQSAL